MMTAERQQFSLAVGLAAAVNALLFLAIAWALAVNQGLGGKPSRHLAGLSGSALPPPPDLVTLVLAPEPAETKPAPATEFVNNPDDQPEQTPVDEATRFISSRNMRAASEEAAVAGGVEGLVTQQGIDKPFLDLRDADFRDGEAGQPADRPPETPVPPMPAAEASPPPSPVMPPNREVAALSDPPVAAPENPSAEKPQDTPPERTEETPPADSPKRPADPTTIPESPTSSREEAAPPAFRDSQAETLIPLPETPARRPAPTAPQTRPAPLPLTRIPDRVPDNFYKAGTKTAKLAGTISNKGESSLDAKATAEGRFGKTIRTAIEKNWRRRMLSFSGLANPGLVEVEFEVDAKGRISNVKLANPGEANPVMQDCALSAVIDAKLPPPPAELLEELQDNLTGGRMRCSFSFLIY